MSNGAAVPLPLPEPASPPAHPSISAKGEIERQISKAADAVADAVVVLGRAILDHEAGSGLKPATRAQGGEAFLRLYELQQSATTDAFAHLMHLHGKRMLWERNAELFRRHFGNHLDEAALDVALDELIGHISAILAKVTAIEKALAS